MSALTFEVTPMIPVDWIIYGFGDLFNRRHGTKRAVVRYRNTFGTWSNKCAFGQGDATHPPLLMPLPYSISGCLFA